MKRFTDIIAGVEVQFVLIGNCAGWFFNLGGEEYSDYLTLADKPKTPDEWQVGETFDLLKQQVKLSIMRRKSGV